MESTGSVTKFMATKLITFKPDLDICEAMRIIVKNKISGAPVVDEKGDLVGMLSEKDCIRVVVDGPYNRLPGGCGLVSEFMSRKVSTISVEKTVMDAAYAFSHSQFRRFPVVDNGKLVGQISRRDVLTAILKLQPEISHVPSSWKPRQPMANPSKETHYTKNS